MFGIFRIIIGFAFLIFSAIIIKKSASGHKRKLYMIFAFVSLLLTVVLMFLPFENLFITFDSPQSAYNYCNAGKSDIRLVVKGNNCDMIVDSKNNSENYLIIPKTDNGWKIGLGSDTKRIVQQIDSGITVYVYQYKNTDDYFISILDTNGGTSNVYDEYNTDFYTLEKSNSYLQKTFVVYYGHIPHFDSKYTVTVNGLQIRLTANS